MNRLVEIVSHQRTGLIPRQNRHAGFRKLSSSNLKLIDRFETLRSTVDDLSRESQMIGSQSNPAIIICGASGTGKTKFLDEIAGLRYWNDVDLDNLLAPNPAEMKSSLMEMKPIIRDWVTVCITWNLFTSFLEFEKDDLHGILGLSVRMLFTHWFELNSSFGFFLISDC